MDPEEPTNNRSSSVSVLTRESTFCSLSPTQSPPIQLMEREIPEDHEFEDVSAFTNRCSSSSSSEWSSVSNESLFSIHITNSLPHDESIKSDDLTTFSCSMDAESLKTETPPKKLHEPQKVVRWKTQVERPAEEGAPPEGHKWQPSPYNTNISSDPTNHTASKPKKKLWWSLCKCGWCTMPKWSCWKMCPKMTCFNCKPKKASSSHSTGASGPKKPPASKKGWCCFTPTRLHSWSCPCHCCCDDGNLLA